MAKNQGKVGKTEPNFQTFMALPERLAHYLRLWFHLSKADWDFLAAKVRQGQLYREWSKSKGKGKGRRYFAAPCAELKKTQTAVLNRFLSSVPVHFCRHGGQKGSSIFSNAAHHAGFAKTVFALDIVNAFPSVYRSRVRACLEKPFNFSLRQFAGVEFSDEDREQLLETVVDLLVWNDRLPQGPPTSPRVFDIVCGKMDQTLFALAEASSSPLQGYRLSIYADNITISSDGPMPEQFRNEVVKLVEAQGFHTHSRPDKMSYFSPETGTVPVITGLVILPDGRTLMHSNKVNQFRGRLHRLLRQEVWDETVRGEVAGILGFIGQIYPANGPKLPGKLRQVVEKAIARVGTKTLVLPVEAEVALETAKAKTAKPKKSRTKKPAAKKTPAKKVGKTKEVVTETVGV